MGNMPSTKELKAGYSPGFELRIVRKSEHADTGATFTTRLGTADGKRLPGLQMQ